MCVQTERAINSGRLTAEAEDAMFWSMLDVRVNEKRSADYISVRRITTVVRWRDGCGRRQTASRMRAGRRRIVEPQFSSALQLISTTSANDKDAGCGRNDDASTAASAVAAPYWRIRPIRSVQRTHLLHRFVFSHSFGVRPKIDWRQIRLQRVGRGSVYFAYLS